MVLFVICFVLQIYLFAKVIKQGRLMIPALAGGVILPPVIALLVVVILKGYLEGLFESLTYIFFSYLHILFICVLLIVKGAKTGNNKYRVMGVVTIISIIAILLLLTSALSSTSFKIGG